MLVVRIQRLNDRCNVKPFPGSISEPGHAATAGREKPLNRYQGYSAATRWWLFKLGLAVYVRLGLYDTHSAFTPKANDTGSLITAMSFPHDNQLLN